MFEKLKSILSDDTYFMALLVVLVSIAAFGLGRLSVTMEMVEQAGAVAVAIDESGRGREASLTTPPATDPTPAFVASKNGSRYHRLDCPGAKQMSEQNKIYFATTDEARAAGYTPAANCSGLE